MDTPQTIIDRALTLARSDATIVIVDEVTTANIRWANNAITSNGVTRTQRLTVVSTVNAKHGTAAGVISRTGLTFDVVENTVRAAEVAAAEGMLAEDAQSVLSSQENCLTWNEEPGETSIHVFDDLAPSLKSMFCAAKAAGRLVFGYAQHSARSTFVASSKGLRRRHDQKSGYIEVTATSCDRSLSTWAGAATAEFTDIDLQDIWSSVVERLGWQELKHRIILPVGRYETLLSPAVVADLMLHVYASASARDAQSGRTVFSKSGGGVGVGRRLSPLAVTLRSDPHQEHLQCAPFVIARTSNALWSVFDNGLPVSPVKWIADGVLAALVQTRYTASLTRLPVTPRVDNLIMESEQGKLSLGEMVRGTSCGLLITRLFYINELDSRNLLLTGLTRDGVYLIERGEIQGHVNNFRFNESPIDLLSRISEIGISERALAPGWGDFCPRTMMPPLRVHDFNMSSISTIT